MKNYEALKQQGDVIWNIANLLRGPYRPPQYRRVSDKFIDSVSGMTYGVKMPRANWEMIGSLRHCLICR